MTTFTQIDKYAQSYFVLKMRERGFRYYKNFTFAKENPKGICYVLASQILSSKENVRIIPFVWVPEFDEKECCFKYPNDVSIRAEFPRWEYPDWLDLWSIKDEVRCHESFALILSSLDKDVIPWFYSIKTGKDLINALNPEAKTNQKIRDVIPEVIDNYR